MRKKMMVIIFIMIVVIAMMIVGILWGRDLINRCIGPILDKNLVRSLDNPYIQNHYNGWKDTIITDEMGIKIPQEWDIQQSGNRIWIQHNNAIIAKGIIVEGEGLDHALTSALNDNTEYLKFIEEVDIPLVDDSFEDHTAVNFGVHVDYGMGLLETGEENATRYYSLAIEGRENYYEFCFHPFDELDDNAVIDFLEAIAYSYRLFVYEGMSMSRGCQGAG